MPRRSRNIIDDSSDEEVPVDIEPLYAKLDESSKAVRQHLLLVFRKPVKFFAQILRQLQLKNQELADRNGELTDELRAQDRRSTRTKKQRKETDEDFDIKLAGKRFACTEYVWVRSMRILSEPDNVPRESRGLAKEINVAYRECLPPSVGERYSDTRVINLVSSRITHISQLKCFPQFLGAMSGIRSALAHRLRNQVRQHHIHPASIVKALQADPINHDTIKSYIGFDSAKYEYKFSGPFLVGQGASAGDVDSLFRNPFLPNVRIYAILN